MKLAKRVNRPVVFNNIFDSFFNDDFFNVPATATAWNKTMPAVNIKETENEFVVELAAPGKEKSDFNITLDHDILTIASEVKEEKVEENNDRYTRKEFHFSAFKRSFTLPETVNSEKIEANYLNGILTLVIPKKEEAKQLPARTIEIG